VGHDEGGAVAAALSKSSLHNKPKKKTGPVSLALGAAGDATHLLPLSVVPKLTAPAMHWAANS
jgi:hypothetical protein